MTSNGKPGKAHDDSDDTAADAGSESPEEGAAAMAAAEDAIADDSDR